MTDNAEIVSMPQDAHDRFAAARDKFNRKIDKLNGQIKSLDKRLEEAREISKERAEIIDKLATQLEQAKAQTIEMWTIEKFSKYREQLEETLEAFHKLIPYNCGIIANSIIRNTINDIEECLKE